MGAVLIDAKPCAKKHLYTLPNKSFQNHFEHFLSWDIAQITVQLSINYSRSNTKVEAKVRYCCRRSMIILDVDCRELQFRTLRCSKHFYNAAADAGRFDARLSCPRYESPAMQPPVLEHFFKKILINLVTVKPVLGRFYPKFRFFWSISSLRPSLCDCVISFVKKTWSLNLVLWARGWATTVAYSVHCTTLWGRL